MTEAIPVPDVAREGSPSPAASLDAWRRLWAAAHDDPDSFWLDETWTRLAWRRPPTRGLDGSFHDIAEGPIAWFSDGTLNACESCVDQHLEERSDQVAILWEGDEPGDVRHLTYGDLHAEVCKAAHTLQDLGVKPGERVVLYMGMVPEAAIAMLACARVGAVHSVVFGGFSSDALRDRILDCGAQVVITQDEGLRGGRTIPLKQTVDRALEGLHEVSRVLVVRRTGGDVPFRPGRDVWWHEHTASQPTTHEAVERGAEDPLFILYTSGSTGRPKGVVHTIAGYLTWTSFTHELVFDLREGDVFGCVADVGWITGHSYIVYGPLVNGTTTVMFESTPLYPDPSRYWNMVARHGITQLYTAPTALRTLAAHGAGPVLAHDRSSLRVLGTVGEPIDPETWRWYFDVVGDRRCPIVDTWWQTETGGISISGLAPATPMKPAHATKPLPGIEPVLVDEQGRLVRGPTEGRLCIAQPWPGIARTVWGDHDRYVATYFSTFRPYYFTGDGCSRDSDGDHRITGRVDDVLNVSGHRMGTAEFEAALTAMEEVAECAIVGFPHPVKGQGVYAYVVLQPGESTPPALADALQQACRQAIGAHARIDVVQVVPGLPKTRSGKVMRRILRKIAENEPDKLGDTSTLADPSVVDAILEGYQGA